MAKKTGKYQIPYDHKGNFQHYPEPSYSGSTRREPKWRDNDPFFATLRIDQGCTQAEIANTYAMALVSSWPTDWKRVNEAIVAKWPKGLNRVKTWAWKIVNSKGQWQPGKKPTP